MLGLSPFLLLAVAYVVIFLESTFNGVRVLAGAQVDLLPSLVVYASLTHGFPTLCLLAVGGGLLYDSLSANTLGVSILPLLAAGWVLHQFRHLILRGEVFAQWMMGCGASMGVPLLTVVLMLNLDRQPLVTWFSLWQWLVMGVVGGAMTPLWFIIFDYITGQLQYRQASGPAFRPDREIKRGRG